MHEAPLCPARTGQELERQPHPCARPLIGKKGSPTVVEEREWIELALDDDSGRAIVEAANARLLVGLDAHLRSGLFTDPDDRARAFVEARGERTKGFLFNRQLGYREGVLEEGELVAVFGVGRWKPDPDPARSGPGGYRGRATRLRVREAPSGELLLTDDPSLLG